MNLYGQNEKNFKAIIMKWKNSYNDLFYSNKELVNLQNFMENLFDGINDRKEEIMFLIKNITKFVNDNENLPINIENVIIYSIWLGF
jgi:transcription termination factor NusB